MKSVLLLFFAWLSHISYADSDVTFSGDVFSEKSLQKLHEFLESSEVSSNPVQLRSAVSVSTEAVINDYVDKLVTQIQSAIVEKGLDTITVPDVALSFKHKYVLVTYSGVLKLTQGNVTNISSVKRNGDVVLSYSDKYLNLEVPLAFNSLNIKYHYKAKVMNIGPSGRVIGKVSSTTFRLALGFNFTGYAVDLNDFAVQNIGDINLSFKGNSVIDWLLKIITNLVIPSFKKTIKNIVETNVYNVIVDYVDTVNNALQGLRQ